MKQTIDAHFEDGNPHQRARELARVYNLIYGDRAGKRIEAPEAFLHVLIDLLIGLADAGKGDCVEFVRSALECLAAFPEKRPEGYDALCAMLDVSGKKTKKNRPK